ncbi:MAG: hypothetical protein IJU64_06300 [Bacilli bacterium]|nr:hypothetical protein [Bacilli bacterium]
MKSLSKAILLLLASGFLASCACAGYEVRSSSQPQSSQTSSAESSQKVSNESEEDSEEDESEGQISSSQQQSSQQTSQSSSQQTSQSASQQTSSQTSQSSSQQTSQATSQQTSEQTSQATSQQTSEATSQQTSQQTSEQTSEQTSQQTSQSSSQSSSVEPTQEIVLTWGNSTSIGDKAIKLGTTEKLVTLVLVSSEDYEGSLRVWVEGYEGLKPYLTVKVMNGDVDSVDSGTTLAELNPSTGFDHIYNVDGSTSGKSYSVFASFSSGMATDPNYSTLLTKSVSVYFDWAKAAE